MNKYYIIILVLLVWSCQNNSKFKSFNELRNNQIQEIDIKVFSNSIIVPVIIGEKVRHFRFDTGASTFISPKLKEELRLETIIDSTLGYDYYGNSKQIFKTIIPSFTIGQTKYANIKADIIRPIQDLKVCNIDIDGFLGSDFFAEKVVQVDIKNKKITISNSITNINTEGHNVMSFDYSSEKQKIPLIKINFPGKNATELVLFDTGSNNHFYRIKKSSFNELLSHNILTKKQIIDTLDHSENGSGLFGKQKDTINYMFEVDSIEFIGTKVYNCPVVTFDTNHKSILGAPSLNFGLITIDYKNKNIYFKPYSTKPINLTPKFGMYLEYHNGNFVTRQVKLNSIAEKNGIKQGYKLIKINSINFDSLSQCELIRGIWKDEFVKESVSLKFLDSENKPIEIMIKNNR
ncbi:aspartyl protease family protein [uncultured Sunxiuqinia sp.]|uniref:aspartyl protease family protein n=1 Tax=uncultured Sunxiuqinia sp. TaxID=1573825 RepID=UPI002AA9551D|nr:aspartyl protease family protein [uncultured Sunxiuqinia sp.]